LACLKQWITHNPQYAQLEVDDLYNGGASATNELEQVQGLLLNALQQAVHHNNNDAATTTITTTTVPELEEALGVVYNVSRDYDAAVSSFRNALKQHPNDYSLWNKLGATLANSNQSEQALEAYQRALELRPKYARAWLNMAISHSNLHNYDEAARCYLQTLALNPSAEHCWSYLRIALSCAERWDLLPLVAEQDLKAFQEHFDFVSPQ
jgi:peroxin-5